MDKLSLFLNLLGPTNRIGDSKLEWTLRYLRSYCDYILRISGHFAKNWNNAMLFFGITAVFARVLRLVVVLRLWNVEKSRAIEFLLLAILFITFQSTLTLNSNSLFNVSFDRFTVVQGCLRMLLEVALVMFQLAHFCVFRFYDLKTQNRADQTQRVRVRNSTVSTYFEKRSVVNTNRWKKFVDCLKSDSLSENNQHKRLIRR